MKRIITPKRDIYFYSSASVGGFEEGEGPLGEYFDIIDKTDFFGQNTYELAEGEMARICLNTALSKGSVSHKDISFIVAGDLQNQCVATSLSLSDFNIPLIGIYGACSTATEAILLSCSLLNNSDDSSFCASLTSSHNSAAERQFRTPLEYGCQRQPSAQWTSTSAGAFILSKKKGNINAKITSFMIGKPIDSSIKDGANMGGAMAFAAADTVISYFNESGEDPDSFDHIVTGDLGEVGSLILEDILKDKVPGAEKIHKDCGLLLYDSSKKDCHSGASGAGTSASVLSSYFLPLFNKRKIKKILFLSTGALMSPSSILQGTDIFGIAPLIKIERE